MEKTKPIIKGVAIGIVFLFVGVIIIQSTGVLNKEYDKQTSMNPNDFSHSETWWNDTQNNSEQTTLNNTEIHGDFTNSAIIAFLDKVTLRYPLLKQMGKEMGLTKQGVSETIRNVGDDNMIKIYISIFSRILGLQ